MKPKVTKIIVEIGDQELELTPEQARELRDELNGIVGDVRYIPRPARRLPYLQPPYIGDVPPFVPYTGWPSSGTTAPTDTITVTSTGESDFWYNVLPSGSRVEEGQRP